MSTDLLDPPARSASPRKPRRQVARSTARPVEDKVKTAVLLSAEMKRRLEIEEVMSQRSQSEIVEELIREHIRRWVVSDRGNKPDNPAAGESAGQSTNEVSALG